jgi:hypothetical protein
MSTDRFNKISNDLKNFGDEYVEKVKKSMINKEMNVIYEKLNSLLYDIEVVENVLTSEIDLIIYKAGTIKNTTYNSMNKIKNNIREMMNDYDTKDK